MRKGQITLFVILGIVILIAVGIFMFVVNKASEEKFISETLQEQKKITDFASFNVYMQACLESSAKQGVAYVIKQGGYYKLPKESEVIFTDFFNPFRESEKLYGLDTAPYYIYGRKNISPTLTEIENNISERIQDELLTCLDFEGVSTEYDFEIEYGIPELKTSINRENILFELYFPINLTQKNSVSKLDKFNYVMNYNLDEKINIVQEYIAKQMENLDYFNVGKLTSLANENEFIFESTDLNEKSVYIEIYFPDYTEINENALIYAFIVELN